MEKIFISRAEFSSIERYYSHQHIHNAERETKFIYISWTTITLDGKKLIDFHKSHVHNARKHAQKNCFTIYRVRIHRCDVRERERKLKVRENIERVKQPVWLLHWWKKISNKNLNLSVIIFIKSAVFVKIPLMRASTHSILSAAYQR